MENSTLFQWILSFIFTISGLSLDNPVLAAPNQRVISFQTNSYDLNSADADALKILAAELIKNPGSSLAINEHTRGVKKSSLDFIIEHNRTLRIFQALVREGVDPARILFDGVNPVGKGTRDADRMAIDVRDDSQALSTKKLTAQGDQPAKASADDFTINFPSASAEAVNLLEDRFKEFLSAVGQPGRDAVIIEGHTDSVGNVAYNKALGELRALTVYEKLVRAGLPPYRVDTESKGMAQAGRGAEANGGNQADRKVVVRWTKNEQIAAVAAKEEQPQEIIPPKQEEAAPPAKVEAPPPVPEDKITAEPSHLFDIVPFAGALQPLGEWRSHAKYGFAFGLGLGRVLWSDAHGEARLTLFGSSRTRLSAKESDRSGPVKISIYDLRFDYAFGPATQARPFLGAGLGYYRWTGKVRQPSTGFVNQSSGKDNGLLVTGGWDVPFGSAFFLCPQISYNKVSGSLFESMLNLTMELRWRI